MTGKLDEKTMKETQALGTFWKTTQNQLFTLYKEFYVIWRWMFIVNEMWEMCLILLPECHSTQVIWCCNECMYGFVLLNNTTSLVIVFFQKRYIYFASASVQYRLMKWANTIIDTAAAPSILFYGMTWVTIGHALAIKLFYYSKIANCACWTHR